MSDIWEDRRVKIGYETAEELARKLNPFNFRGHPDEQAEALDDSLDLLGWVGSVKINIQTGRIFDGELRIKRSLVKDPSLQIPVDYYDLTPDEELLALQVHDTITEQAQPIADKLAALLERTRHLTDDKPGLAGMLEQLKARAGVNGTNSNGKDVEPQIDKAAQLAEVWGTRVGQIWELGAHRLAVGDCTDKATVEAVMRGESPLLLLTDVPYNVSQGGRFDSYESDITKAAEFEHFDNQFDPMPFLELFFEIMPSLANWFIYVGAFFMGVPVYQFLYNRLKVCSCWVYAKTFAVHNIRGVGFAKAYELAVYAWNEGHYFDPLFGVDGYDYGIYAPNEGGRSYDHATSKPLALFDRHIRQLSKPDNVVLDPFSGSGTTLIACENLGRKCRAIELDPGYAAVTIQRWADLTTQQPRLISG